MKYALKWISTLLVIYVENTLADLLQMGVHAHFSRNMWSPLQTTLFAHSVSLQWQETCIELNLHPSPEVKRVIWLLALWCPAAHKRQQQVSPQLAVTPELAIPAAWQPHHNAHCVSVEARLRGSCECSTSHTITWTRPWRWCVLRGGQTQLLTFSSPPPPHAWQPHKFHASCPTVSWNRHEKATKTGIAVLIWRRRSASRGSCPSLLLDGFATTLNSFARNCLEFDMMFFNVKCT